MKRRRVLCDCGCGRDLSAALMFSRCRVRQELMADQPAPIMNMSIPWLSPPAERIRDTDFVAAPSDHGRDDAVDDLEPMVAG